MPRLLIHFARYGPYHHARLSAAHEVLSPLGWEVHGLETAGTDATYAWDESKPSDDAPRVITAFPGRVHEEITAAECRNGLPPLLDALAPDAIAIAGWASPDALACLSWCRKHDVRRIVMSETREADGKRVWWKELIKRYLISRFDGALVGGKSHRGYLVKLGMPADKIHFGYNVVDNGYFSEKTQDFKTQDAREEGEKTVEIGDSKLGEEDTQYPNILIPNIHSPYFLASNRFIERKNLARLVEAYGAYARRGQESGDRSQESRDSTTWPLVLLGDGEQKPALIAKCHALGLQVIESAPWDSSLPPDPCRLPPVSSSLTPGLVYFPGFRQIDELPRFYAHAGCFIHPALEEPWGLVINEAMACGLPILSSNNVGAAEELVEDGVNGWKFDPNDVEALADVMQRVSEPDFPLSDFSSASRRILEEVAPTAAFGKGLAGLLQR